MTTDPAPRAQPAGSSLATLAMCCAVALIEGVDLQSMGIAASGIAAEFNLNRGALGAVLSASPCGLLLGAFLGGRLADLRGRKTALMISLVIFGSLQLATVWVHSSTSLLVIRFLCGLGFGGALPNLIALTAEASNGRNPILNVVITVAAFPVGGAFAAYLGILAHQDWRVLFYVGGIAPLLLSPLLAAFLTESPLFRQTQAHERDKRVKAFTVLFAPRFRRQTWLLWASFVGNTLVLYLFVNWLPQLMAAKGFNHSQSFTIQIVFNLASAIGAVGLGWIMQQRPSRWVLLACYAGLAVSLPLLAAQVSEVGVVAANAAVMGACLVGAQLILYGMTPGYYPTLVRGTGTGAAVAAGRLGSVIGPFLGGQLLSLGLSATQVMQSLLPIVVVAAWAAFLLTRTPPLHDLPSDA